MNRPLEDPASIAVVETVAAAEGVRPVDLQPPLWNVVDPEALDRLVDGAGESPSITFEYRGHTVRIDATGEVVVDDGETGVGCDGGGADRRARAGDSASDSIDRTPAPERDDRVMGDQPDSGGVEGDAAGADGRSDATTDD